MTRAKPSLRQSPRIAAGFFLSSKRTGMCPVRFRVQSVAEHHDVFRPSHASRSLNRKPVRNDSNRSLDWLYKRLSNLNPRAPALARALMALQLEAAAELPSETVRHAAWTRNLSGRCAGKLELELARAVRIPAPRRRIWRATVTPSKSLRRRARPGPVAAVAVVPAAGASADFTSS